MTHAMPPMEKVTAFVTRPGPAGQELLLFKHPNAGIQLPAGTVEMGEAPERAVLREVAEETGLTEVALRACIGCQDWTPPDAMQFVAQATKVYARPDPASADWAEFRRGVLVTPRREEGSFTQVLYEEWVKYPNPEYLTCSILGWVPSEVLCGTLRRYFYHLTAQGPTRDRWTQFADHHNFECFWSPLSSLPDIVEPQNRWIEFVQDLGYTF